MIPLAGAIDIESKWAEGCSCHELDLKRNRYYRSRAKAVARSLRATAEVEEAAPGDAILSESCKLKGRRAHEYACGEYDKFVSRLLSLGKENIVAASMDVPEHDRPVHLFDWHAATDMITTQTTLRSSYWKTLRWKLAGMGSDCAEEARQVARDCKRLFQESTQAGSAGPRGAHPITRRFFDPATLLMVSGLYLKGSLISDCRPPKNNCTAGGATLTSNSCIL